MTIKTAMILAAGRGQRMKHLTENTPKPLLKVNGMPLIEHQIRKLMDAGIIQFVINTAYLGHHIQNHLGNGSNLGCKIQYSDEGVQALETAGGIIKALPLLGNEPFLVTNADVWTDYPYQNLISHTLDNTLAHLILVPNPSHNLSGDFGIQNGLINQTGERYTFSGIGLYHPNLFNGFKEGILPLTTPLNSAIEKQKVSAELYTGMWQDIGTPERLHAVNRLFETP